MFDKFRDWSAAEVDLKSTVTVFVMEATRGGADVSEDIGDVAFDDLQVEAGQCSGV